MGSIGHAFYMFDKVLFDLIRRSFGNPALDSAAALLSNLWFWTPLFIFLLGAVLMAQPKQRSLTVLYGLGTLVLSFQAAFLLSRVFEQLAPYAVYMYQHHQQLPACPPPEDFMLTTDDFSFPDWETAAMVAAMAFSRGRLRRMGMPLGRWVVLPVLAFVFLRVYAGHAYPYDVGAGWLLGLGVGALLLLFARNMDLVLNPPPKHPADAVPPEQDFSEPPSPQP